MCMMRSAATCCRYAHTLYCIFLVESCVCRIVNKTLDVENGERREPKSHHYLLLLLLLLKSHAYAKRMRNDSSQTPNNRNEKKLKSKIRKDSFPGHPADITCDVSQRKPNRSKTKSFHLTQGILNSTSIVSAFGWWNIAAARFIYWRHSQMDRQSTASHFEV